MAMKRRRRRAARTSACAHPHGSQPLTRGLCVGAATAIFYMTDEQREAVIALAPEVAERTFRLDPEADLPEPDHGSTAAWVEYAGRAAELVRRRLGELPGFRPEPAPA